MTIQRQPSLRRLDWHYMAMQIGFWAMFASIVGYQTALLLDRGFSNGEAGLMTSVRCLAGIVCQPLLGGFADRHPEFPLKRIVSLSMLLSLGVSVWYWLAPGMGLGETALVWAVIGGLEVSSYPLMDAMAIQFINDGVPIRYSLGRGLGSLAYALTCVFLGFQVGRSGVESTLLTHVVLVAAEIALVATYPPYRGRPRARDAEGPKPQSALALLRSNPSFTLMLAGVLLSLTAVLPLSNFLVNVVTSRGGTDADLGLAMFVMGAFELPTAFLFPKLLRRFGSGLPPGSESRVFFPITTVFPVVSARKCLRSAEMRKRSRFSLPMAQFLSTQTMAVIAFSFTPRWEFSPRTGRAHSPRAGSCPL